MVKPAIPQHKAALYFNELAPMQGQGERCALFGHFYHLPAPDVDLTRSVVALPKGAWGVVNDTDVNDIVCGGLYFEREGKRQLFAVFRAGETFVYVGVARTAIPPPRHVGFLSGLRMIGTAPYTCGSQNTVYRFDGTSWVDVAGPLRVPYGGATDPILNSIDGFDEQDIYAVGYNGSIVHFDGARWQQLDIPTNQHLHQVLCHTDGLVYACGRGGVVLRGRLDRWEDLSSPERTQDFWGLAAFRGDVYLCTYSQLFRIVDRDLTGIVVPVNSAGSFYRLASNESFLWATTGTGRVVRFDGQDWLELVWPDSL
jgi:hypothetical protein